MRKFKDREIVKVVELNVHQTFGEDIHGGIEFKIIISERHLKYSGRIVQVCYPDKFVKNQSFCDKDYFVLDEIKPSATLDYSTHLWFHESMFEPLNQEDTKNIFKNLVNKNIDENIYEKILETYSNTE